MHNDDVTFKQLRDLGLKRDNQIFTFYSYKGGVGRTLALCHVAAQLSRWHGEREKKAKAWFSNESILADGKGLDVLRPLKILCLDLDLEAPSIPAFFPRETDCTARGFWGLFGDYHYQKWGRGEVLRQRLQSALTKKQEEYIYQSQESPNIFIMPAGPVRHEHTDFEEDEKNRLQVILHRLLTEAMDPEKFGRAREVVPFFPELKEILKETFDFILVDSRTGLSDEAYATTTVLADAMVFCFRPNLTQLEGIHDVFGRFLFEINTDAWEPETPAIPVLTPRPMYSDKRISNIRKKALEGIFPFADPDRKNTSNTKPIRMVELPEDLSLAIGERLIIPPSSEKPVDDPQAPLFEAYGKLTTLCAELNAFNYLEGLSHLEKWYFDNKETSKALSCLLAAISLEPENPMLWEDIWRGYGQKIIEQTTPDIPKQIVSFCNRIRDNQQTGSVSKFFASLWLSETTDKHSPKESLELIKDIWKQANRLKAKSLFDYALTRIRRYYKNNKKGENVEGIPTWQETAFMQALPWFNSKIDVKELRIVLSEMLFSYYNTLNEPKKWNESLQLNNDLLSLARDVDEKILILNELSCLHSQNAQFEKAAQCLLQCVSYPQCPTKTIRNYLFFLARYATQKQTEENIQRYLPANQQDRIMLIAEIRNQAKSETVKERLKKIEKNSPTLPANPHFLFFCYLKEKQYEKAQKTFTNGLVKMVREGIEIEAGDLAMLPLAGWLAGQTAIGNEIKTYCKSYLCSTTLTPCHTYGSISNGIFLSLAAAPNDLVYRAEKELQKEQWPINAFVWRMFASLSNEGGTIHKDAISEMLSKSPLIALGVRREECFTILLPIAEKLHQAKKFNSRQFKQFADVLAFIETYPVEPLDLQTQLKLPESIEDEKDPRFEEIVERWKMILSTIHEHPEYGPIAASLLKMTQKEKEGERKSCV